MNVRVRATPGVSRGKKGGGMLRMIAKLGKQGDRYVFSVNGLWLKNVSTRRKTYQSPTAP